MVTWCKRISLLLAVPATLAGVPAWAQPAPPAPPVQPVTPAAESPGEPAPPSAVDPAAKVEGLQKTVSELQNKVTPLTKLKLSGYIQGRYEYHQDSKDVGAGVTNQFLVRRGRLKAQYHGTMAEYVLQVDATGSGVALKDAEATFIEPWSGLGLRLTGGQFKWPFGYETLQSSGSREMPERSLVIRRLFPGERDRGLRLQGTWDLLRLSLAVVNGNGTSDSGFSGVDNSTYKDVVGRLGVDLKWLVAGVSGYQGKNVTGFKAGSAATATAPATPASYKYDTKSRYGGDVQVYYDVPHLGGLAVKGELIMGKEAGADVLGWYGLVKQDLGSQFGVFARLDQYDPNQDKDNDGTTTIGGGGQYQPSGNVKLTAVYEHPMSKTGATSSGADPEDDIFTLQIQGMF